MAFDLESVGSIDDAIDVAVAARDGGMFRKLIDLRRQTAALTRGRPAATPGRRSALMVTMENLSARCRRLASDADCAKIAAVTGGRSGSVRKAEHPVDRASRTGCSLGYGGQIK